MNNQHSGKPGPRLWIVRIVHEAYVLATTEDDAKAARAEIERWEEYPAVTAEPWAGRQLDGWSDRSGVYGTQQILSLRACKKLDAARNVAINDKL